MSHFCRSGAEHHYLCFYSELTSWLPFHELRCARRMTTGNCFVYGFTQPPWQKNSHKPPYVYEYTHRMRGGSGVAVIFLRRERPSGAYGILGHSHVRIEHATRSHDESDTSLLLSFVPWLTP